MATIWNKRGSRPAALSFSPRAEIVVLAALAGLTLVFFWPAASGRAWIPRGGGDLVSFLWPTYAYAARSLRGGRIPLWNPHLYSGAPFAADNQSGLFYPVNLLAFFLLPMDSYRSMEWLVILHFWLAGGTMYAAARMERLGRWPALAAAIAFMFSDVFVTHVGNLNIVAVSAWLPLGFACVRRGLRARSAGWCAGAGALLGIAALAGHAQMTLIVACAAGLYGLWEVIGRGEGGRRKDESSTVRRLWATARLLILWGIVAAGVSAIAVLPAVELTAHTARARLDYAEAARYSLPPEGLAGLFSPLVFGRGPAEFWGTWERVEAGYAGAFTLLLAATAFLPAANRGGASAPPAASPAQAAHGRLAIFLALLFALGLLVALGENTPVHYWLYRLVPGFAQMRVPARFTLLSDFSLSFLAAIGLHAATVRGVQRRALMWTAGLLAAAGGTGMLLAYSAATRAAPGVDVLEHRLGLIRGIALYGAALAAGALLLDRLQRSLPAVAHLRVPIPPAFYRSGLGLAACAVLAVDLISLGAGAEIEPEDPTLGYQRRQAIEYLRSQPGPARMDAATGLWQPDAALMHGLEDIGGISNPLALARYDAYYWSVGYRGSPQYNFLGAQFVVADKGAPPADATFVPVYDGDPQVDVYLNTGALPRVTLAYLALVAEGGPDAFAQVHGPSFNPPETVVIEGGPGLLGREGTSGGHLAYVEYGAERIVVEAITPATAYLVFAEVWYPGWRASVDGRDAPIYRANYAFRAVLLEAGEHRVELSFEPWSWKAGAAISGLAICGLAAWGWRKRRLNKG